MTYFNMGRVGPVELRLSYVALSDSLYLTPFQTGKNMHTQYSLYVILSKNDTSLYP